MDYTPHRVAYFLRHWDEVDAETRADLARCLQLLPHNDGRLLRLYGQGFPPKEALALLGQRGDPHKRLRTALFRLVSLLEGTEHGTNRAVRPAMRREDNRRS